MLVIRVPWKKELDSSFYYSWFFPLSVVFFGLMAAVWLWIFVTEGRDLRSLAFVVLLLSIAVPAWFLDSAWRVAVTSGKNEAHFSGGEVWILRRLGRRTSLVGVVLVAGFYAAHTLAMVHYLLRYIDYGEGFPFFLHPVVNLVSLAALAAFVVWQLVFVRADREVIVLGPEGIRAATGARVVSEARWDDILAVRFTEPSGRGQEQRRLLSFEMRPTGESTRDKWWVPLDTDVKIDCKGFDTEPNALFRVARECIEHPETRSVLGTAAGVYIVTYGPPWHEVAALGVGEEWRGELADADGS